MVRVGIVVLNFKNIEYTIKCVDSILHQKGTDNIIAVIDNSPETEDYHLLKHRYINNNQVMLIKNERNLGYAKGNNIGIGLLRKTGCQFIFVANSDIYFSTEHIIRQLTESYEKNVGILLPIIKNLDGTIERRVAYKKKYFLLRICRSIIRSQLALIVSPEKMNRTSKSDVIIRNMYQKKCGLQLDSYIINGSGFLLTPAFFEHYTQLFPETFLYYEEWATLIYLYKAKLLVKIVETDTVIHKGGASTPDDYKKSRKKAELSAASARKVAKLLFMSSKHISKIYGAKL